MASITCRNGETFPAKHTHTSVAEVRACQGAPADWKPAPRRDYGFTESPWIQGLREDNASRALKTALSNVGSDPKPRMVEPAQDDRNVYLNPKGINAQLAMFDRSKLGVTTAEAFAGAEKVTKDLAEFKGRREPMSSRVDPELEAKVPDGRYAVTGEDGALKFYRVRKVTKGQYAGRTFVDVQAGDELHPVRYAQARAGVLRKIAADVRAAAVAYGRELGVCSQCGRTLTDPESIAAGIGPICASKL